MRSENFESLSDQDLRAIADRMGLELPQSLDRIFVVEEIVEALAEDRLERDRGTEAPLYVEDAKYWCRSDTESPEGDGQQRLQQRYNETGIKALVRDPTWAFTLWDISETDRAAIDAAGEDSRLFLRVTEVDQRGGKPSFFDIPVSLEDSQWYINLPRPEARYRIDLAFRSDGKVKSLAHSLDLVVPRQYIGDSALPDEGRRLLDLSGIADLAIEFVEEDNP
ncbi:MAG TPA: DUF4912 domain-containing protein, partial [Rectinemataceae bacterium]|nr:DUF4912 domain-containing protein [Rectinemataceae bacterium]